VKVGDFGLSKINRTGTNRGLLGSPVYMSPEMLLNIEYDEKTDIYSFGTHPHTSSHHNATQRNKSWY